MDEFWSELPDVLTAVDGMEDAAAAATLIEFLELYREDWSAIVASSRNHAGHRALVARAMLILAEKDSP